MPLQILRQDITKMCVDAIVNTTNEEMVGYSGVDLAVHTAAGVGLDEECAKLVPLGLGEAKITGAYSLPCKYVIHTSGPVWRGGLRGESILLRSCYLECLKLAVRHGCESVAFPLISAGTYGYPKEQVLKFAVGVITEFLLEHEIDVYLCVFDKTSYAFSKEMFQNIVSFMDGETEANASYSCDGDMPLPSRAMLSSVPLQRECGEKAQLFKKKRQTLDDYIKNMDKSFREMLFDLIDKSGMTDVECYKKANVDKRTFSKIKSNKEYRPSKQTAVAFAIALRLDLNETERLLGAAGFALSGSKVFDMIIRYFIKEKNYDIFEINEALFEFDQVLLGSF